MRRVIRVVESLRLFTSNSFKKVPFELGDMYINKEEVVFALDQIYADLVDNAVTYMRLFDNIPNEYKEFRKYLPSFIKSFKEGSSCIVVIRKDPGMILLKDILNFYGGSLDPKHVAWILSSLYNLCCYLQFMGSCHNDISLNSYFISPEFHTGALLGGWWYATKIGEKIKGVPARTYAILPQNMKDNKLQQKIIDLILVKKLGREMLIGKPAPEPLVNWLETPTSGDVLNDYTTWRGEIIDQAFGGKFFTPMNLKADQIYKEGLSI